ncbi:MAG: Zn-ribbon domain-containing OB-fold protein [Minwuia sp.]|uniref:Zn-ribbon domain-containing OB-fold protein n=1 Tax=Minwuia sp. TaxID=2493630 RepID=UPI003A88D8E2
MSDTKPAPHPNADSEAFWAACAQERLTIQKCGSCGAVQHYPRSLCIACGSHDLDLIDASGRGEVFTFTINHRAPSPAFAADAPYVIALIDLEEGPRMMMNVIGCEPADVRIGMKVKVVFEPRGETKLPQATPA